MTYGRETRDTKKPVRERVKASACIHQIDLAELRTGLVLFAYAQSSELMHTGSLVMVSLYCDVSTTTGRCCMPHSYFSMPLISV